MINESLPHRPRGRNVTIPASVKESPPLADKMRTDDLKAWFGETLALKGDRKSVV